jgi:uncharacterized repeat protein (TIGR01451 family)
VLVARFDDGLKHPSSTSPIESRIGMLEPGKTGSVFLNFRVMKPGKQCFTVEVSDIRNLGRAAPFATKQQCVTAPDRPQTPPAAALNVEITGPESAVVGDVTTFSVVVTNIGDTEARQVKITAELGDAFDPASIGVPAGNPDRAFLTPTKGVVWNIDSIPPKQKVTRVFGGRGKFADPWAWCRATATDATQQPIGAEKRLAMQPAAGVAQGPFKIEIAGNANPAKLNSDVQYQVSIKNLGRESEKQVRLTIIVPPEMSLRGEPMGNNVRVDTIDGKRIIFKPIAELRPTDAPMLFNFVLHADRVGDAAIQAEVTSFNVTTPMTEAKTTKIAP